MENKRVLVINSACGALMALSALGGAWYSGQEPAGLKLMGIFYALVIPYASWKVSGCHSRPRAARWPFGSAFLAMMAYAYLILFGIALLGIPGEKALEPIHALYFFAFPLGIFLYVFIWSFPIFLGLWIALGISLKFIAYKKEAL